MTGDNKEQGVNYHLFLLPPFKGGSKLLQAFPAFLPNPSFITLDLASPHPTYPVNLLSLLLPYWEYLYASLVLCIPTHIQTHINGSLSGCTHMVNLLNVLQIKVFPTK